jgi:hypothetical protein
MPKPIPLLLPTTNCWAGLFIVVLLYSPAYSQDKKIKPTRKVQEFKSSLQFSLFPGISTNGTQSGSYYNQFSINFFGGLSRGNRIVELGLISNATIRSTTGIQIAGLANIVGANAFLNLTAAEENTVRHEDYESNTKGIQFSGVLNYVRNNTSGIQVAGGMNVVGFDVKGAQLSGIGNSAGGFAQGLQLAGFYNVAKESVAGVQLSSLFNYTDGQLSGTQISLINKARLMSGKKSTPPTAARGLQIGLINFCKATDGIQIGLINFGGDARGKQIGLINFFSPLMPHEKVRNGTPVGLLNLGSKGSYFRMHYSEAFAFNLESTTGNCLNCSRVIDSEMPFDDRNQIFNQNALILGYDPFQKTWGFGYGFQKQLYNKATMQGSPLNRKRVITYGIKFLHLNKHLSLDRSFNLVNKLNLDYGKRWRSLYLYAGVSFNYFLHETGESVKDFKIRSATASAGGLLGYAADIWPGYEVGFQF